MSLNYSEDKGGNSGALIQMSSTAGHAPSLQASNYAAWAPSMEVFLQRNGAEGIHKKVMTKQQYEELEANVARWNDEVLFAAAALVADPSSSSIGLDSKPLKSEIGSGISSEVKEARRLLSAQLERSRRMFGHIWYSMPEELRAQSAHITPGWAYGLWNWLSTKFQSTEQDRVGELLAAWTSLSQQEEESFDAYRARVNRVQSLLEHAKEKQSARMYEFTLLGKLNTSYKPAVLALRASDKLKDESSIDWEEITRFINSHEREVTRFDSDDSQRRSPDNSAMSVTSASRGFNGKKQHSTDSRSSNSIRKKKPLSEIKCYECHKFGHFQSNCPESDSSSSKRDEKSTVKPQQDQSNRNSDRSRTGKLSQRPSSNNNSKEQRSSSIQHGKAARSHHHSEQPEASMSESDLSDDPEPVVNRRQK